MPGRPEQPADFDASRLGELLRRTVRPTDTGEPWISLSDIAQRVSLRRRRKCSPDEVAAGLRPGNVPAADIVRAALELRNDVRREAAGTAAIERTQVDDDEYVSEALRADMPGKRRRGFADALLVAARRKTLWGAGVLVAAGLTLIATGVIPGILRQLFNGAAIEDAIHGGPAIVVTANTIYVDGPNVPSSSVIPSDESISRSILRSISRPDGAGDPGFVRLLHSKGIAAYSTIIRLIVSGNRNQSVRIVGIEPVDMHRAPPLHGVLFEIGAQGASDNIRMGFNLDQASPQAMMVTPGGAFLKEWYFLNHTILLADGEQAVLIVEAATSHYDASFNLAINYIVAQSVPRTIIIDNAGKPFQVTATAGTAYYQRVYYLQSNFSVSTRRL